jgi:hypothetical protein
VGKRVGNIDSKIAKGRKMLYSPSCVAWMDLLGYGSMLREAKFDPTDSRAHIAVRRLNLFHETVASEAGRYLKVMSINDGAVSWRDLSLRGRSVTFDFMSRAIELHQKVNQVELKYGFPGARMVIAVGFRIRNHVPYEHHPKLDSIINRLSKGQIEPVQAVFEAYRARPFFGAAPELHANFAFSKAYMAEAAGSKAGFIGPNCFIDLSLFTEPIPEWIRFSNFVNWNSEGLSGRFGALSYLDRTQAGAVMHNGILDAIEVSKRIFSGKTKSNPLKRLGGKVNRRRNTGK